MNSFLSRRVPARSYAPLPAPRRGFLHNEKQYGMPECAESISGVIHMRPLKTLKLLVPVAPH